MAERPPERRLAAILAADVVGYSGLVEQDEAGTLARLRERRDAIILPLVDHHRGRLFKQMGDGFLVEFASAVDAVRCAMALQERMVVANAASAQEQAIVLRIGINLGDVVVDDTDIHGDGVNIAARLETIADPGGICVSAGVFEQFDRQLPLAGEDMGPQALKNIARPVRAYRITNQVGIILSSAVAITQPDMFSLLCNSRFTGDFVAVRAVRAPLANTQWLNGENRPFLPTEPCGSGQRRRDPALALSVAKLLHSSTRQPPYRASCIDA